MSDPAPRTRFALALLGALLAAAAVAVVLGLLAWGVAGGLSEGWRALRTEAYLERLGFSLAQAGAATLAGLALGLPASWCLARSPRVLAPLFTLVLIAPVAVPGVVLAAGVGVLAGGEVLTSVLIIGTHALTAIAAVVWLVTPAWEAGDPRASEAARLLGAGRASAYLAGRGRELPVAVRRAAALAFFLAFAAAGTVAVLSGGEMRNTEAALAFDAAPLAGGDRAAFVVPAAQSLVQLLVASLVLVAGGVRWPSPAATRAHVPVWLATLGALYLLAVAALAVAPLVAVVREALTDDAFAGLLDATVGGRRAATLLAWTGVFAAITAAVATLLAWAGSAAMARGTSDAWARTAYVAVALPILLTGAAIGWAGVVLADLTAIDLDRTFALTAAAHVLIAYPFALRILGAPRGAERARVLEAAMLLGQSPRAARWRAYGRSTVQALFAAALVSAVLSAGEVAATALLTPAAATPGALGITRALMDEGAGEAGAAYALGAVLAAVAVIAFTAAEWLRRAAARVEAA